MKEMSFEELKEKMLFRRITEWDANHITLDNGMVLTIEMTDNDCCASAYGEFEDVTLDACITNIGDIEYQHWEDDDTYGCSARVNIVHNRNKLCEVYANADAGNGGYYYSVASFIVHLPNEKQQAVFLVGSES